MRAAGWSRSRRCQPAIRARRPRWRFSRRRLQTRDIPAPGEAWADAPLLDMLGLKMGDPLLLGDAQLRVARIIVIEPDRGTGFRTSLHM
jgi:predicted lysophospholipase L1 biosynthesis ABC-type transport system permease subunit